MGPTSHGMGIFLYLLVEPFVGYYFVKPVTLGPPFFSNRWLCLRLYSDGFFAAAHSCTRLGRVSTHYEAA